MTLLENLKGKLGYLAIIVRFFAFGPKRTGYLRAIHRSGLFDRSFYRARHPQLLPLFLRFPERHYILLGETAGFFPRPDFSPHAYLRLNPDVAATGRPPFRHYIEQGRFEDRPARDPSPLGEGGKLQVPEVPVSQQAADFAVVAHVHYPELWPEIERALQAVDLEFDLFVTITGQGEQSQALAEAIRREWPAATVLSMPNHGRDIFPWVHLIASGALSDYRAVCKLHTKRSPQLRDGAQWRRQLIEGVLPGQGTAGMVQRFLDDERAAMLVAAGSHLKGQAWWGANQARTRELLERADIPLEIAELNFAAGSIYWIKPGLIKAIGRMNLALTDFEAEQGATDGTTAHAFERALGYLVKETGLEIHETPRS